MSDNIVKVYQGYIQLEGTAVVDNDPRLSDARTPTAHAASHGTGQSDAITIAESQVTNLTSDLSAKAPLSSPTLTGTPAAPTAAVGTNTTQVATTAFVNAEIANDAATKVDKSAVGNLLTANQAGFEDNATTGWAKTGTGSFAASNTYAKSGTYSAAYTAGSYISSDPARTAVTAGKTYTATISYYSPSYTGPITFRAYWATAGNADISYIDGSTTAATTGAWQTLRATGVAPATATSVYFYVSGITAGQTIYVDEAGLWQGAGGQWALPGTPIANLGFYTDESVGRRLFQWDANNSRFQQTFGDTGWRDVTSLVTPPANLTITTIYVRRINSTVYVRVKSQAAAGIAATAWSWSTIGTGFTPVDIASQLFYYYRSFTDAERQLWYRDNTTADIGTSAANPSPLDVSWIHVTSDAWPTTLPGTAVGSIPQ